MTVNYSHRCTSETTCFRIRALCVSGIQEEILYPYPEYTKTSKRLQDPDTPKSGNCATVPLS